jgi:hypothetical protein
MNWPTKITFADMRDMGVRDVLIYCCNTDAAIQLPSPTDGRITSASAMSSRCSSAGLRQARRRRLRSRMRRR